MGRSWDVEGSVQQSHSAMRARRGARIPHLSPERRRRAVEGIRAKYGLSACRIVDQPRGTRRYTAVVRADEDALTRAIVALPLSRDAMANAGSPARRFNSLGVIETMDDVMLTRGVPEHIRSDYGAEMTAKVVRNWLPGWHCTSILSPARGRTAIASPSMANGVTSTSTTKSSTA
jgi:hypothetical protein